MRARFPHLVKDEKLSPMTPDAISSLKELEIFAPEMKGKVSRSVTGQNLLGECGKVMT